MAVELYPHNQTAYEQALHLMETSGRAAVVHPTGTGKSFIAFKLAEEHPGAKLIWLAPSEYIFRSQRENYLEAGGEEAALSGITFLT
ncbi:MAG: DEAD/DEAH box helicase family protein, partial [Lachnospiraceae bacterium]|nr:DEAD/DEAH box helicase family protein [Lachnospiraceae bacterium]